MRLKRSRSRRSDSVKDRISEIQTESHPIAIAELPEEENKIEEQVSTYSPRGSIDS